MVKLTDANLLAKYATLLTSRRKKEITAKQYAKRKENLLDEQDLIDFKKEQLIKEASRLKKEAERKAKAAAKREAKSIDKRTFKATFTYDKQMKKTEKGKTRLIGVPGVFSDTFTIVRNVGESKASLQKRADKERLKRIRDMNESYIEAEQGGDTFYRITGNGSATLHSGGGGGGGMSRVKPFEYEGTKYHSIANNGKCVPTSLHQLYPKYSYKRIVEELNGDDTKPVSCDQVLAWCKLHNITCIGCDADYNIIVKYFSTTRNHAPLYFVEKDNHFYVMDKTKGLSIANQRKNSSKVVDEVKKVERVKKAVDDQRFSYDVSNTHYIVRNGAILKQVLQEYVREYRSIPKLSFGALNDTSIYLKSFIFGDNNKVSYDPHYKLIEKVSKALDMPVDNMKSISDSISEKYIPNMPKSLMNNVVMDIFMNWKQRQHFAHLVEPSMWYNYNGVEQCWDANKQYTHALRNSKYKWMLFNMFSLPEPFDGVVKDGYYFITTKNTMPCKGNGWYSRIIVDYLIEEGIEHSIDYQLIASETLDCDYFKKFVDGAIELCPDGFKYITNTFCGSLNIHDSKSFKVKSGCVQNHIINDCFKNNSSYIEFDLGDEKIYASAKINKTLNYENNMPMYSQVLDFGAVQLAKTIKHLEMRGSTIRSYNTDSITFKHYDVLDIDLSTDKIGGWKTEEVKEYDRVLYPRCNDKQYVLQPIEWENEIKEGDCDLVDYLVNNSAVLEAPAGYGKSHLINRVVEKVGSDKVVILGYTNISANNIGGSTFHKTFKIGFEDMKGKYDIKSVLKDKTHLVTDEISQVPPELYKIIEEAHKMGITIIISGDFKQILPVGEETGSGIDLLKLLCKNHIELTTYRRGDTRLLNVLNKVRDRKQIGFDIGEKGNLHFCFTKNMRNKINAREMVKVKKNYYNLVKNDNLPKIYMSMPLRSKITKKDGSLLNGERWIITRIQDEEYIELKSTIRDCTVSVDWDDIHKMFVPGYAMTIHSSQGLTISEDYTVWIEKNTAFTLDDEWRMIYTACSRAKDFKQVGLIFV